MAIKNVSIHNLNLLKKVQEKKWFTKIGLEIHAQIQSKSKLMSGSSTMNTFKGSFITPPNTFVSYFDAALPGTLPTINKECIYQSIRTALALNCSIHEYSYFERKHYFYCDLPLGYQITQQRAPIASNGYIIYKNNSNNNNNTIEKKIRINRIQIEQDSGKSLHDYDPNNTVIDLNRAGMGLMEIVFEPDIENSNEAIGVVQYIQQLVRHLETCDGNFEAGSLRCDVNVSVHPNNNNELNNINKEIKPTESYRIEIKNMNSLRNMMAAIDYEVERQIKILEKGDKVKNETRIFDVTSGKTKKLREKKSSKDYRFLPEPDLLPCYISKDKINKLKDSLAELPEHLITRYKNQFYLQEKEATLLAQDKDTCNYFESMIQFIPNCNIEQKYINNEIYQMISNWILNDLYGLLKVSNTQIRNCPLSPKRYMELLGLMINNYISSKIAKQTLEIMYYEDKRNPLEIINEKGWKQTSNYQDIEKMIDSLLLEKKYQKNIIEYKNGKTKLFGFFMGELMKKTKGKINPEISTTILKEKLNNYPLEK